MSPSSHLSIAHDMYPVEEPFWGQDAWLSFNQQLSNAAELPNEAFLDQKLEMAQDLEIVNSAVYWLTISRIAELAIKLAGDYADSCEFQAAGDLLVIPRRIDVYQRGNAATIQKDRHRGLSEQFAEAIGSEHSVNWLKRETHLQIKSKALLPHLNELLSSSGYMAPDYLYGFRQRMCRVADTIAFWSAWQIVDNQKLYDKIKQANPGNRELIEANRCRFDGHCFVEMGEDIENLILYGEYQSRFLKRVPVIRW